ncbi:hypothetical protein ACPXCE_23205 [Streptomyces sp. DT24]|uniref:hypothetical protein n=1 Tax=unclassified Streptomyces TaxID=2593676 RepID=UPI0023B94844|nr:hypothetical protein [Streptomyces sp. AM 4-1-1]WEH33860.1 hypothetical protein PZB75_11045 [Streptomyces sp. AM 4-1-1]
MHGYGYPPQQPLRRRPTNATLIWLRVLFVTLAVMSCSLFSWAAMLRLAIVTRRGRDWGAFAAVLALNVGLVAFIGAAPEDAEGQISDRDGVILCIWMLTVLGVVIGYYLHQEIDHYGPGPGRPMGPLMNGQPGLPGPYGSFAQPPYTGHTAPGIPYDGMGQARHTPGYGYPPTAAQATPFPNTAPSVPTPAPDRPTPLAPSEPVRPTPLAPPQRIDQVRAELDELSDYLRKDGDSR